MYRLLFFCLASIAVCLSLEISTLPKGFTTRQSPEEAKYMKYHKCVDTGEAYGAAYFITKAHLLQNGIQKFNLTWVNCEMGSFTFMKQMNGRTVRLENRTGVVIQSLDVLDFSVVHLSAYERLQRRWKTRVLKHKKHSFRAEESVDYVLKNTTDYLRASLAVRAETVAESFAELNRTVAIMPFLGNSNGAGHSVLSNRFLYLKACFWSIYAYIPHVIAVVQSQADYDYCREESGLPFFDVIFARGLPKAASLPVATSQLVRTRLLDGRYDFDYIYFTESDQILLLREAKAMLKVLQTYPRYVLVPHRLMPYPETIVKKVLRRAPAHTDDNYWGWSGLSCCLDRQNCMDKKRASWRSIKSPNVTLVHAAGFNVPLGNANFLKEEYHYCTMMPGRVDVCP